MEKTQRVVSLTLEIIYLLTGEVYGPVKKESGDHVTPQIHSCVSEVRSQTQGPTMAPAPPPLTLEGKKIMEVIQKIIEMLAGEDNELRHGGVKVETSWPITSSDDSGNFGSPQKCPSPTSTGGCKEEEEDVPIDCKEKDLNVIEVKIVPQSEDETPAKAEEAAVEAGGCNEDALPRSLDASGSPGMGRGQGPPFNENPPTSLVPPNGETPILESARGGFFSNLDKSRRNAAKKRFLCSQCGAGFTTKAQLVTHHRAHTGQKPFACSECGKGFTRKAVLVQHMRQHTGERPYSCSECGRGFIGNDQRIRHERLHSGQRPYVCNVCGKGFTRNSILTEHRRIHTGEKPFVCQECGKAFARKNILQEHTRNHSTERPFECKECGKGFASNSRLARHLKNHTGRHACTVCNKSFTTKGNLASHHKLHTGEKLFACPVCSKSFPSNSKMITHQRSHTGEKPFLCSECGKGFVTNYVLVAHRKRHQAKKR